MSRGRIMSVQEEIEMKFNRAVLNIGKVREYNLLALICDHFNKGFPFLPTFAVDHSMENMLQFVATRGVSFVNTDFFTLLELVEMSYFDGSNWRKITNASFPLLRQTRHVKLGDANVVKAFSVATARSYGYNYSHVKADGMLCTTFNLLVDGNVKVSLAYTENRIYRCRMLIPMAGELCDGKFIIQSSFSFDMVPPSLSIGGKEFQIYVADELVADSKECIASFEGVEYKFKDTPTIEVDLTKHTRFLNVVTAVVDGTAVIVYGCPEDVTGVVECKVVGGVYTFLRLRPDKQKGQSSYVANSIVGATSYSEIKQHLNNKVVFNIYFPDWKVMQDFNVYLYANQEFGLASSHIFDHFVETSDTFVHPLQVKRIKDAMKWNTPRFVTFSKITELKQCHFLTREEIRKYVVESQMTLSPAVFCDVMATKTGKYVDMRELMYLCSEGDLLYIRNDITAPTVGGKIVPNMASVPDTLFGSIILFYLRNSKIHNIRDDNGSLMSMCDTFLNDYGHIGGENEWEHFTFKHPEYYGLMKILSREYDHSGCVGNGSHICSFGGTNHRKFVGKKHYQNCDDGSFQHGMIKFKIEEAAIVVIDKLETLDIADRIQYNKTYPLFTYVGDISPSDYYSLFSVLFNVEIFLKSKRISNLSDMELYGAMGELYGLTLRQLRYGKHFDI